MATATENIRGQVLGLLDRLTPVERVQVAAEILNRERPGCDTSTVKVFLASLDQETDEAIQGYLYNLFLG